MVPIYGITSWLSLVVPSAERVLGALRDCYEAYAIYTFIALLIAVLEDGKGLTELINRLATQVVEEKSALAEYDTLVEEYRRGQGSTGGLMWLLYQRGRPENIGSRPHEHIVPPCCCCYVSHRPSSVAAAWLYQCQLMALQFVIMKPLLTVIPLTLAYSRVLDIDHIPMLLSDNSINWAAPKIYILFAENVSVFVAFYGLLAFYHGTEKDLEWCDPWPKFLCIKGVVFATFWQTLLIEMMSALGWVDDKAASQIQNLLICIEMLLASLAHFYIFPHHEWATGYKKEREKGIMLKDTLALRDFVKDMRLMVTTWDTEEQGDNRALSTLPVHSLVGAVSSSSVSGGGDGDGSAESLLAGRSGGKHSGGYGGTSRSNHDPGSVEAGAKVGGGGVGSKGLGIGATAEEALKRSLVQKLQQLQQLAPEEFAADQEGGIVDCPPTTVVAAAAATHECPSPALKGALPPTTTENSTGTAWDDRESGAVLEDSLLLDYSMDMHTPASGSPLRSMEGTAQPQQQPSENSICLPRVEKDEDEDEVEKVREHTEGEGGEEKEDNDEDEDEVEKVREHTEGEGGEEKEDNDEDEDEVEKVREHTEGEGGEEKEDNDDDEDEVDDVFHSVEGSDSIDEQITGFWNGTEAACQERLLDEEDHQHHSSQIGAMRHGSHSTGQDELGTESASRATSVDSLDGLQLFQQTMANSGSESTPASASASASARASAAVTCSVEKDIRGSTESGEK